MAHITRIIYIVNIMSSIYTHMTDWEKNLCCWIFLWSIFATLVPWVNKYTQVMTTIKVTKVWDKVCIPPGKSQVYFRRKMKVIDIDYTCGNLPFTHFIPNFCDLNGGHYLSLFVHSGHQISKYRGQKQQQKWFILKLWYCYVLKNWIPQPGLF